MSERNDFRKLNHKHYRQPGSSLSSLSAGELEALRSDFRAKDAYLGRLYEPVSPLEYYRDMFPLGSFEGADPALHPFGENRRPNGILNVLEDPELRGRSYARIVFDDLGEIARCLDKPMVVISPVGYSGRRKRSQLAYQIFGFVIDLDDVGVPELNDLLYQMENGVLPFATYIVNSGGGVHVVYLFDSPVPAMPRYYDSLNNLKAGLTDRIWNQYTSKNKKKQFQGIFQSFRAVGSPSKLGADYRVGAYRVGRKTTIHELNTWVEPEDQCVFDDLAYTSLQEAEEVWPEWYERRIIEGRPVGDYQLTEAQKIRRRAWYDAWIKRIRKGAHDGNRHYCIGVLFNYAQKAEIPLEDAYEDALQLLPYLNSLTEKPGNEFTENDILDATVYYDREFIKMGRKGIYRLTKIDIGETKRNGQRQADHLEEARAIRDIRMKRQRRKWTDGSGRPSEEQTVLEWVMRNPGRRKADCIRETGLSKPTVYKWWPKEGQQ